MLNIDDPTHKQPKFALFNLGFRPFFLFASIFSLIALALWGGLFVGHLQFSPHGNPIWWHGHEMLFGFVTAVIAGFLLTAVQNWTGQPGLKGYKLAGLFSLWLLPRILLINNNWAPLEFVATLDLLFAPMTAFVLGMSVYRVKQWKNFIFVPILLMLTITNGLSYYGLFNQDPLMTSSALHGAALVIAMIVALLGGRVIPFFTDKASNWQRKDSLPWLEKLSFISLIAMIIAVITQEPLLVRILAGLSAAILLFRWSRWGWQHTFKVPLLWSLHFSYVFIPLGLLLISTGMSFSAGFHAITVGGMGGMILAMMARVSLGHTGRTLTPPKVMVVGFALILLGTVFRVGAGLFMAQYLNLISLAIACWVIAFAIFCIAYGPLLCKPRLDGRPG